jgi:hypothetical protein
VVVIIGFTTTYAISAYLTWILIVLKLKQQSAGRHVALLENIILIPNQPVSLLFKKNSLMLQD